MSHDRPSADRQICVLNTIGQFIDINNIMPWPDVCFLGTVAHSKCSTHIAEARLTILDRLVVIMSLKREQNIVYRNK